MQATPAQSPEDNVINLSLRLDVHLLALHWLRENHFGVMPEDSCSWAQVGSVARLVALLDEALTLFVEVLPERKSMEGDLM